MGDHPGPGGTRFTILGCGSSPGIPRIGGDWGACDPKNPINRRLRSSLLVEQFAAHGDGVTRVLVDTSPDLRQQMLSADVDWIDGVLYTHPHADHIHGIDDLRAFVINKRKRVEVYADRQTTDRLFEGFRYCFEAPNGSLYPPILNNNLIEAGRPFEITGEGGPIPILPFRQEHGSIDSLGFRFGPLAYSPDISALPDDGRAAVQDLDVWILDALMYLPHPSHLSVEQSTELAASVGARNVVFTHLHTPLDYDELAANTPSNCRPAYDGMTISYASNSLSAEISK